MSERVNKRYYVLVIYLFILLARKCTNNAQTYKIS